MFVQIIKATIEKPRLEEDSDMNVSLTPELEQYVQLQQQEGNSHAEKL
jgi:hypothetical protein